MVLQRPMKLWGIIVKQLRCGGGVNRMKEAAEKVTGSGKSSELLKLPEWWKKDAEEEEVRRKEEALQVLKQVACRLQQEGSMESVLEGCVEVRMLAKEDPQARTTLALLGVIPPLVALLDAQDPTFQVQIAALYALLNLAIANDANKAAIVKAGAVHKMLNLTLPLNGTTNKKVAEVVVANFLGLSALDSNKLVIGSSGAIHFLVKMLKDLDNVFGNQAKHDALRALYNLSIAPSNVLMMLDSDLIQHLLCKTGDMDMSERILSILCNVVAIPEGRKRISSEPDAFMILIDIFNWTDSPGCQEKASYILMVMAHKSYGDRQAMVEAGIISSLLELTLLGSTLAQTRASRMLEFLHVNKGKQVPGGLFTQSLSAPLCGSISVLEEEEHMISTETKAVKQLVQQSLQHNMKKMVKRANLMHEFVP